MKNLLDRRGDKSDQESMTKLFKFKIMDFLFFCFIMELGFKSSNETFQIAKSRHVKYWVSIYLYYQNITAEETLLQIVVPFLASLNERERSYKKFFFVRYFDRQGTHIRLRLLFRNTVDKQWAEDLFCRSNYSTKIKFVFVPYRREVSRYGGSRGMQLAESIFMDSSEIILKIIQSKVTVDYNYYFGASLTLNLIFALTSGLRKAEVKVFFYYVKRIWESSVGSAQTSKLFRENFKAQKTSIYPIVREIYSIIKKNDNFDIPLLNDWRDRNLSSVRILDDLLNDSKINSLRKIRLFSDSKSINPKWVLMIHYIHMNNNRLGIYNGDEAFQAYCIYRSL